RIREAISRIVPGVEQLKDIERTRKEFQIPGRTFHTPKFATPSGRARLFVHELPEWHGHNGQLRLATVRSEGQFNTVVYEDYDLYRGQERRDVILVHPDDMERLGLQPEQRVTVSSECGSVDNVLVRAYPQI